jgi:hypothetical protein
MFHVKQWPSNARPGAPGEDSRVGRQGRLKGLRPLYLDSSWWRRDIADTYEYFDALPIDSDSPGP